MKKTLLIVTKFLDILLFPLTIIAALWLKLITRAGMHRMPVSESIFMKSGVLPVQDHYYQPLINPAKHLSYSLRKDRFLPGLDFNDSVQLKLIGSFHYNKELLEIPIEKTKEELGFYYNNGSFISGDAEYLYNILRHFRPKKIIEIGSGYSTLLSIKALENNKAEDTAYEVEHICVEPFEMSWLEKTPARIIRKKVEEVDRAIFESLQAGDILFIDSSHVIRPQGDVLFEYLEILPVLAPGVLVHIHDIFTPKDYLDSWIFKEHKLWNEQYLLEAFLTLNKEYEVIGALNYLAHHYREEFSSKCPIFLKQPDNEPGSFWIRKK
jgi:predicted O-methyltransferase YrrM